MASSAKSDCNWAASAVVEALSADADAVAVVDDAVEVAIICFTVELDVPVAMRPTPGI